MNFVGCEVIKYCLTDKYGGYFFRGCWIIDGFVLFDDRKITIEDGIVMNENL